MIKKLIHFQAAHPGQNAPQKSRLMLNILLMAVMTYILSGCSAYNKIPYFQNIERDGIRKESIQNYTKFVIQPEDILGINVVSLNPEASALFNNQTFSGINYNNYENPSAGYLVDEKGEIHFPLIGSIKASGLTTTQLRQEIQKQLVTYLKEPVVNIRILNFKISVMGDVLNPGVYNIQNEKVTLPEALTMAGDLNITAKRTNLLLIREVNGDRVYIPIDLTSKNLFHSPYYYLKNNDLIYVEPNKTKYATVNRTPRSLGIILSAVTAAAILLTRNY
ncbi:MAG TPA: polysaccharide biosynthesis/export family protein [Sphingobacteriaceae bacterium]